MYDLIVVGAGPAGLTASIYAKRAGLNVLVLEKSGVGGQIVLAPAIENYPGFSQISGAELMHKIEEQAKELDVPIKLAEVKDIQPNKPIVVKTSEEELQASSVVIASGATHRHLGVPGEKELLGKGVSYCATCDGNFFKDKVVAVVGGGNRAVEEAVFLSRIAKQVYLVHRRDCLRAEKINQNRLLDTKNAAVIWNTVVERIEGKDKVEKVLLFDVLKNEQSSLAVDGLFVAVGIQASTGFVPVEKGDGFIKTDETSLETSIPGIFAAGDCRAKNLRQVVTAVGEGALAAVSAKKYLESL